ncbi:MAG: FKBP-type peptidyl-prolyl cis-trans isomerase [Myxococcota bacterium]
MHKTIAASLLVVTAACQPPPSADGAAPAATATSGAPTDSAAPSAPPPPPAAPEVPADVAAPPADAEKSASGLAWKVLTPGTGTEKPRPQDKVSVHYSGWTTDGKMFDSSVTRGRPATFALNRVIPGWTEGVGMMVQGEKRRFWIPANLAYGETPMRPGAPAGQLTFDVELLSIEKMPDPPPMPEVPADVKAAPSDAKKTPSGLAYKALESKEGGKKPTAADRVKVHYTGWTTDGKIFDSSIPRGEPATFPLGGVIKGWTEGLQLMGEGETFLFWIPAELAYGETPARPGAPAGMLVFQVTLLQVM